MRGMSMDSSLRSWMVLATTLATSVSETNQWVHPVVWTNNYHGARVFGTTFGHSNETWQDPVFITLVSRGLLWAAGRE